MLRNLAKSVTRTRFEKVIDGNTAASYVAYALSEDAFIYPITPSSAMAEMMDVYASQGKENVFGQSVNIIEMQSEAGAAGAVHGGLTGGGLTSTFTASQGLLLMLPNMYKIAGELLPGVFHVAARSIAGHALSIYGDHQDVMATRASGFTLLSSSNVQECHDLALVAHLSALEASLPFLHFFDGFRTSHELQKAELLDTEEIAELVEYEYIKSFKERCLSTENPMWKGSAQGPDVYFQSVEATNNMYKVIPDIVKRQMDRVSAVTGRPLELFNYYGHPEAERVVILMGSGADTTQEVCDYLNESGEKVGVVKVSLFRPWSTKDFVEALPKSVKKIAVMDRTKEPGSFGEPLYLEVVASLRDEMPDIEIFGGRFGLSSREFNPKHVMSIYENLKLDSPMDHFTVGINDDVSHLSLPEYKEDLATTPASTVNCMFFGIGGDGTVGANHRAIEIIGDNTPKSVQGYFFYSAKKSGGFTVSHLRFGDEPIRSSYGILNANFVGCHVPSYLNKYDVVKPLRKGGILLLNSPWNTLEEINANMPSRVRKALAEKEAKLYNIDATQIAESVGLGNRINNVMQTAFFQLAKVLPIEEAIELLKESIVEDFSVKGDDIVEINLKAVDESLKNIVEIEYDADEWKNLVADEAPVLEGDDYIKNVVDKVNKLEGDDVPVSELPLGGQYPTMSSRLEKPGVANNVPKWLPENCIQCNTCTFVCPHSVLRPFVLSEEEMQGKPEGMEVLECNDKGLKGNYFLIQPSVMDCTGCMNCVNSCPTDPKSLEMVPMKQAMEEQQNVNWDYAFSLPRKDTSSTKRYSVKGVGFMYPYLEFHGACAGCGEATYLKIITQLFGDRMVIANATGCSSIWGGSFPSSPWAVDENGCGPVWANSLFEDNAEYGLGIAKAQIHRRDLMKIRMNKYLETENKHPELNALFEQWIEVADDFDQSKVVGDQIKEKLATIDVDECDILSKINDEKNMLAKQSNWIVGGDGWAYDIGFGGLIHTLAVGEDVNVLVFDTEMYSNTGGQSSKATPPAAVVKFAAAGKEAGKTSLGKIAMSLGNVYVASVSLGGNKNHYLKVLKEATEYDGPSLIIAYAPCIGHGVVGNMAHTQEEEELVVKSGYWPLYRYDPRAEKKFNLDFKKPDFELLDEWLGRETRFASLGRTNPERAGKLSDILKEEVKKNFQEFLDLDA